MPPHRTNRNRRPWRNLARQETVDKTPADEATAVTPTAPPPAAAQGKATAQDAAATTAPAGTQTIRVIVDVLEDLMTLVSELVLTRNQLLQLARGPRKTAGSRRRCSGCRTSRPICRKA